MISHATLIVQMQYLPSRAFALRVVALLCVSGVLTAQSLDQPSLIQPGTTSSSATSETEPLFPLATPVAAVEQPAAPLDLRGKTDYYLKSAFSPQNMARVFLTTGFSHAMDSTKWGHGVDAYTDRLQARMLEHVTRRSMQFAIGAARGEDPRFYKVAEKVSGAAQRSCLAGQLSFRWTTAPRHWQWASWPASRAETSYPATRSRTIRPSGSIRCRAPALILQATLASGCYGNSGPT